MIKKVIHYTDFNDLPQVEEHYFHLSKNELIAMETEIPGGMIAMLDRVGKSNNGATIIKTISDFVLRSYGAKSPDGRSFDKTDLIRQSFASSAAFDQLISDLLDNPAAAVEFINGMIPKDLQDPKALERAKAVARGESADADPLVDHSALEAEIQRRQSNRVPDPNGLDSPDGTWPAGDPRDMTTGLDSPRDDKNELVPWAFREPTNLELAQMSKPQMMDAFKRKNSGWVPRDTTVTQ